MTLIVEDGSGVAGANSFIPSAFVTTYLTARGRVAEGSWSSATSALQDAACIAGTDHIENAWRELFLGVKQFRDIRVARGVLTLTAIPVVNELVVVGAVSYRFVDTLSATNDVLRATTLSGCIDNLVGAIAATPAQSGVEHEATTVENPDATAAPFYDDTMSVCATVSGTAGNAVVTTTTVTGGSWSFATLNGGSDLLKAQPLSFPRLSLFDRDGNQIIGMPERLKFATAEYAVRARVAALAPDPDIDALGGTVTRLVEKVGPISTDTSYLEGTTGTGTLPAYPAADRLLDDYVRSGSVAIRG